MKQAGPAAAGGAAALPRVHLALGRVATSARIKAVNCPVLGIGVAAGPDGLEPDQGSAEAAVRYGIDFAATAERAGFTGRAGQTLVLELPVEHSAASAWSRLAPMVVLVGVGGGDPDDYRRAGASLARAAKGRGRVAVGFGAGPPDRTRALVEGYLLGAYRPVRRGLSHSGQAAGAGDQSGQAEFPDPAGAAGAAGSSGDASRADRLDHPGHLGHLGRLGRLGPAGGADQAGPAGDLVLIGAHQRQAVDRAVVAAGATALARDLANWPSNQKTPAALAARLAEQAAARESITATVWGPDELAANGFAATLAVGAGAWQGPAADPALAPRLLVASHSPAKAKGAPHIVIVGKGITFDSGGLDLKPAGAMATMKTDMAGAAVAVATALAAADLGLAARVTAVAPLAQNSFGAASYRPGDVIEIGVGEGKTAVEVGDTDAEGRLVLADALSHAAARLKPDYLIDVATLTGAAKIALGPNIGAVFSRDRVLAERIEQAGRLSGERWWRLPLADDYREALTTPNAEISSVGKAEWGAGAITAALFLERFAGRAAWAHLDIAGPARAGGGETWTPPGATGFAVRTLIALVERLA